MVRAARPALAAESREGFHLWWDRCDGVEVRFLGRGPELERQESLERIEGHAPPVALLRQVHSARLVEASPGSCGEGDALVTQRGGLALSVISADCVPVLVAGDEGSLLAVHAGWRGLAAGIVQVALRALPRPGRARVWLGPAIGPCCYEVGAEVAAAVVAAAGPQSLALGQGGERPHLDLHQAVVSQLRSEGVEDIEKVGHCTRCHPEELWSYRRDGARAGRNIAFIWRQ